MEARDWRVAELVREAELNARLQDGLEEIAGDHGKINPRILGRWIERHADTRCAGYYIERRGTKQHVAIWRIRRYQTK
jgi:hypothetical protein